MNRFELIMIGWNLLLSMVLIVHSLKFGLVQRILNSIVNILAHRDKQDKLDKLYGRE